MALPAYAGPLEKTWHYTYLTICALIFVFLIGPIFVVIPLSFNAAPYFTFSPEMLSFDPAGYSLRWYEDFWGDRTWQAAVRNSFIIAIFATLISTTLGTVAALGLSQATMPYRAAFMAILISPMIVPLIISAAGMYFFYSRIGLASTHIGVILAHAILGTPFVVITVTATLVGFDRSLIRAAASMGATPTRTFSNSSASRWSFRSSSRPLSPVPRASMTRASRRSSSTTRRPTPTRALPWRSTISRARTGLPPCPLPVNPQ